MSEQSIVCLSNNYKIDSNVEFWQAWEKKLDKRESKWYKTDLTQSMIKYNDKPQNCAIVIETMNSGHLSLAEYVEWQVCIFILYNCATGCYKQ